MTIQNAMETVEKLRPHAIPSNVVVRWLSDLDMKVFEDLIKTHMDRPDDDLEPYGSDTPVTTELLIPEPYDMDVYTSYIKLKIDEELAETNRYVFDTQMFNTALTEYYSYYNRRHMPASIAEGWRF